MTIVDKVEKGTRVVKEKDDVVDDATKRSVKERFLTALWRLIVAVTRHTPIH